MNRVLSFQRKLYLNMYAKLEFLIYKFLIRIFIVVVLKIGKQINKDSKLTER